MWAQPRATNGHADEQFEHDVEQEIAVSSGDFALATNTCAATDQRQCAFSVTFTPSQTGGIKGAVTVTDSAIGSPQVVNLAGTGQ